MCGNGGSSLLLHGRRRSRARGNNGVSYPPTLPGQTEQNNKVGDGTPTRPPSYYSLVRGRAEQEPRAGLVRGGRRHHCPRRRRRRRRGRGRRRAPGGLQRQRQRAARTTSPSKGPRRRRRRRASAVSGAAARTGTGPRFRAAATRTRRRCCCCWPLLVHGRRARARARAAARRCPYCCAGAGGRGPVPWASGRRRAAADVG
jgi:hypothetical protein